jgi:hypothetical protein
MTASCCFFAISSVDSANPKTIAGARPRSFAASRTVAGSDARIPSA